MHGRALPGGVPLGAALIGAALIGGAPLGAGDAHAGGIAVEVRVIDGDGVERPAEGAAAWIPGLDVATPSSARAPVITQRGKAFWPRVTVVSEGTEVAFPNEDPIFHNVFSLAPEARFDMGLYRNGESRSVAFERAGLVPIYCNIHPDMVAYARVVDSDVFGASGEDGIVRLAPLPDGAYELHVWHERGGEHRETVTVDGDADVSVTVVLDGSSWRLLPHTNKYGRAYDPPDEDDDFRY